MAVKYPKSEKYNFTKNLVKRYKLVTHLDKYLGKEVEEFKFEYEPKVKDLAWHPSGDCTPPPTELYLTALERQDPDHPEKEWGVAMLKTFLVGHFWHQLLQHAVLDIGFATPDAIERRGTKGWGSSFEVVDDNSRIAWPPFHWATGSGDIAPCSIPKHGDYVVDFKTMSGHQYRGNDIPDWAAAKYEAQINVYMDFFDMEKGLIVAIQKDSPHEMKEFEFVRNQPLIDAIYDKWEFVSECLNAGEAPSNLDDDAFDFSDLYTGPVAQ